MQPLVDRTCATLEEIHALFGADNVTLVHVPRERNGEADALANLAMDAESGRTITEVRDHEEIAQLISKDGARSRANRDCSVM